MRILALDLSKRSAGWAVWGPDDARLASGAWVLGTEWTSRGATFARLHQNMTDLHRLGRIDAVYYEMPLNMALVSKNNDVETPSLLIGLAMHAESWAEAMRCRIVQDVHMATWRRHFIGKMPRATTSKQLKAYATERCRQLGFRPDSHDEAEAIGILDYACDALQILPYWRRNEVLRPPLGFRR